MITASIVYYFVCWIQVVKVGIHRHHFGSKPTIGHRVFAIVELTLLITAALILVYAKGHLALVGIHIPHRSVRTCISRLEEFPQGIIGRIKVTTFVTVIDNATKGGLQFCPFLAVGIPVIGA